MLSSDGKHGTHYARYMSVCYRHLAQGTAVHEASHSCQHSYISKTLINLDQLIEGRWRDLSITCSGPQFQYVADVGNVSPTPQLPLFFFTSVLLCNLKSCSKSRLRNSKWISDFILSAGCDFCNC